MALCDLKDQISGLPRWNVRVGDDHVDPDLTISDEDGKPLVVICVAHCDSEKEDNRKVWRNIVEICLCKTGISPPPIVMNIIYEDNYRPGNLRLMQNVFDFQARIGSDWNLTQIVLEGPRIVESRLATCGRDQTKIVQILREIFEENELLETEFQKLKRNLLNAIIEKSPLHSAYWRRQKVKRPTDSGLQDFSFSPNQGLRRGISKLICLSSEIESPIEALKDPKFVIPVFVSGIGWSRRASLRGEVIVDQDILSCARNISQAELDNIIKLIRGKVFDGLFRVAINPIINLGMQSRSIADFFRSNVKKFIEPKALENLIRSTVVDPTLGGQVSSERPWVIDYCLAIGKSIEDRPQGYGISQLVREMNVSDGDQLRFWIPAYADGKFAFKAQVLKRCCEVLSAKVVEGLNRYCEIENLIQKSAHWMAHQLSEIKLCTYPLFRPAEVLTLSLLETEGVPWEAAVLEPDRSFMSGTSGSVGTTAGVAAEIMEKKVFLKAICGSKNTRDKAKELAGRAAIASAKFDLHVLILDGPYEMSEAKMCRLCGWDLVLGINELPSLLGLIDKAFLMNSTNV